MMLPSQLEMEKGFTSIRTLDDKSLIPNINIQGQIQDNFIVDNFDQTYSNQRNSQEVQSIKGSWTYQEQIQLYKLHDELGNKWSMIAEHFQNRNDNSIKNHFYSRLRKALRKLNKIICVEMKKSIKEIKNNVIYKIIEVTEQRHKTSNPDSKEIQITKLCRQLKSRLFDFSYDQAQTDNYKKDFLSVGKQLIQDLVSFNRQYRRKGKKTVNELKVPKLTSNTKNPKFNKQENNSNFISVSQCSLFQSQESLSEIQKVNSSQVVTRRRAKSGEYRVLKRSDSGISAYTNPSKENTVEEKYEAFFKEPGMLENSLLFTPEMMKKQSHDIMVEKMMEEQLEFEFGKYLINEVEEDDIEGKLDSQDHFSDPELDERNFSLFK